MVKKTILVVDDELGVCNTLRMKIEDNKEYQRLIATSGEEGLKRVKMHKPDLVLLDLLMPGMGGLEVLKQIKATAPGTSVAMVTAVHDKEEAAQCFKAGAFDYITKPINFDYMKAVLFAKLFA